MIVKQSEFVDTFFKLIEEPVLSLDTETTGLRPYHEDRLFSIIIGTGHDTYYFNFQSYTESLPDDVLTSKHMAALGQLLRDPHKKWYIHNAKFDMAFLAKENLFIAGEIHCTRALGRVEYNEHFSYSLEKSAERIGYAKDDTVERYIQENKLTSKSPDGETLKHFDKVPLAIIAPYGEVDAAITHHLGQHQEETFERLSSGTPAPLPTVYNVVTNERRLTKTVFRMEQTGLKIDRQYCMRASRHELDRAFKACGEFKRETGREFKASGKLFAEVFESEKDRWELTEKGNPSFESSVLKKFESPAARAILEYRDAKSKSDFYTGFLHHADADDVIHPNLNPDGTSTGRFSGSNPNFQNLTSEDLGKCRSCHKGVENIAPCKCGSTDVEWYEFVVRRAIVPRPGKVFILPDYDTMEYKLMLDYAASMAGGPTELVKQVLNGFDVHQATANVATAGGTEISRSEAKTVNFLTLYGGGMQKLAEGLNCTIDQARAIQHAIFRAAPEIKDFIRAVINAAETRKYIFNWAGRRCEFPDSNWSYKAPNYLIQGGCADVVKFAMNEVDQYLLGMRSKMLLQVHDELVIEVDIEEVDEVPKRVKELMESVYPYKHLPMTCGMEWSPRSMADKIKGFPV